MLTLYRKDGVLYGKCIIERLISNEIKNKLNVSKEPQLVETMLLLDILRRNEYVLLETQGQFKRPRLYNFEIDLDNKAYQIIDVVEKPKPQPQPKKVEPKVESKQEKPVVTPQETKNVEPEEEFKKKRHK